MKASLRVDKAKDVWIVASGKLLSLSTSMGNRREVCTYVMFACVLRMEYATYS